jgi:hypothetical protein
VLKCLFLVIGISNDSVEVFMEVTAGFNVFNFGFHNVLILLVVQNDAGSVAVSNGPKKPLEMFHDIDVANSVVLWGAEFD